MATACSPSASVTPRARALTKFNKLAIFGLHINLLVLLLPNRNSTWDHAMMMMPWAFLLSSTDLRSNAWHLVKTHKWLTLASIVLSLLMAGSCALNRCSPAHFDAVIPPLLWIPVASLTLANRANHFRAVFYIAGLAVAIMSAFVCWESFVLHIYRPHGLAYNVLTAPMILSLICLMGAIKDINNTVKNIRLRNFFILSVALGLTGSIVTQSKTGLMTFIVASIFYLIYTPNSRIKASAVLTAIAIAWSPAMIKRYDQNQQELASMQQGQYTVSSLGERTDCLKWGLQHLHDAPWLGKGHQLLQEQFALREFEWHRFNPKYFFIHHLHNEYLQMAIEHGWPALLLFLAMWITFIWRASRPAPWISGDMPHANTPAWLLAMAAVYLSAFMVDSFTYWVFTWATVASCFGIGIAMLTDRQSEPPSKI